MKALKLVCLIATLFVVGTFSYIEVSGTDVMSQDEIQSSVASIVQTLEARYVYPDVAATMKSAIESNLAKGAYRNIYTSNALIERLQMDLRSVSDDAHIAVHLNSRDGAVPPGGPKSRTKNHGIGDVQNFQDNIIYLEVKAFPFGEATHNALSDALSNAYNETAVIVDLRKNRGGSLHTAAHLASQFLPPNTSLWALVDRNGELIEEYATPPGQARIPANSGPLYVLTSSHTYSAAEYFVWAMKQHGRAVVVGEQTRGGAHAIEIIPINQYFVLRTPVGRPVIGERESAWQSVGHSPDIAVAAEQALEVALAEIRSNGDG